MTSISTPANRTKSVTSWKPRSVYTRFNVSLRCTVLGSTAMVRNGRTEPTPSSSKNAVTSISARTPRARRF